MTEKLGFALVLLVAMASVASLLFLSGTSATGNAVVTYPTTYDSCDHIRCPGRAQAYPLLDHKGYVLHGDYGTPLCICPPR